MKHGKKISHRLLSLLLAALLALAPAAAGTASTASATVDPNDSQWAGIQPLITGDNAVTRNPDPEAPAAWGAVPDDAQLYYHEQEMSAFLHFGVNTFTGAEWGTGTEDPAVFNPTAMTTQEEADAVADQWVQAFKASGFKRLILVGKHHDGFCIWPSQYTERDTDSSSVPGVDVVWAVSKACTKYDIDMGFYLSPWDESAASYGYRDADGNGITKAEEDALIANGTLDELMDYNVYYDAQLREILGNPKYGNNGKFVEIWMDGAKGTGAMAQDYDFDKWFRTIKELEPDARCFTNIAGGGIRWCGNEQGLSGDETCWQKMDIKDGELTPNKNPDGATARAQGRANGVVWSVSECDVSIRNGWFHGAQRSFDSIVDMYYNTVGHGAVWLLNAPPTQTGEFSAADVALLQRLGAALEETYATNFAAASEGASATTTQGTERTSDTAGKFSASQVLDEDNDTYWTLQDGATSGQITIDLGQRRVFDLISIQEYIALGQRIAETRVEYSNDGTSWQTFAETTTVGARRLVVDSPVAGRYVRITVTNTSECDGVPILSSVGVYKTSADMERKGEVKIPDGAVYVDDRDGIFTYNGSWAEYNNSSDGKENTHKGSGTANNSVTFEFTGSQFYVMGIVDPGHGPVEVTVDGQVLGTFDTNAGSRKTQQVLYSSPGLSYGTHTVTLTVKTGSPKTYFDFDGIYYVAGENGILEFSKSTYPTREGDEVTVTVKRTGGSQGDISFKVIDLPGSAVSGQHYNVVDETITLHDGETEATVAVNTIKGSAASLQFYLQITDVTGGALLGNPTTAEIRILDATAEMPLEPDNGETFTEQDPFLMPSVVGQTNKLEAEHMVLDSSGADSGKEIRISDDANASGGKKIGWFEPNNKAYLYYYAPKAGDYTMTLRYQSGRTAGNLNTLNWRGDKVTDFAGEISSSMVNGSLTFGEESFDFTVTEPGYGVIEFYADSHASPNIDWFTFQLKSVPPVPVTEITLTPAAGTIYTNLDGADDGFPHTVRLTAAVLPEDADNPNLVWRSSNTRVASCDQNGLVTAVGNGTATITATAADGSNVSAAATITVKTRVSGNVVISGTPKFGAVLMASVNQISHQEAIDGLTYQWNRDGTPIADAEQDTYTVAEADIGHEITVTVFANAPYVGAENGTTSDPVTALKADGPEVIATLNNVPLDTVDFTEDESGNTVNGKITGLNSDYVYEYKLVGDGEDAWTEIPAKSTEVEVDAPGSYHVRVAATETYTAGAPGRTLTILAANATGYAINIDDDGVDGMVRANVGKANTGDTVFLTVFPDEGCQLRAGSLRVTGDSGDVTVTENDGILSFIMPGEAVTVTAEFETRVYTITHSLTNISCSMEEDNHEVRHGERPTITLTPDTGYELPQTIVVTYEDGSAFNGYRYRNGVVTFTQDVTGNLTILGEGVLKTYAVTYEFTNLSTNNAPITVGHGTQLELTISPRAGYTLPLEITVTMDGTPLVLDEDYTYSAGTMTVTILEGKITGDVVITANGVREIAALTGVTISGTEMEGRRLTASVEPAGATVLYQWIRVDGGNEEDIPGAVYSRYMLTEDDVGKTIKVEVTGTGGYGGTLASALTGEIAADPTVAVTAVRLNQTAATVAVGGTVELVATVEPENATTKTVEWTSSNERVAVVSENGVVTALAEGTAVITVTTVSDGCTAECVVTVTSEQQGLSTLPSVPTTTTTTTTNPDGTTTTTVTDNVSGTVTATTEKNDGSVEVVETKKDGTITTTVTDPEGGKVEKVTTPDEDVTINVTNADGEELAKVEIPAEIPALDADKTFIDVREGYFAEEAINNMAALGVVNGKGDRIFDPKSPMKRSELAKVLYELANGKEGYTTDFIDVPSTKWYADSVAWAVKAGVVKGVSDTEFEPERTITREELAAMLCRYARMLGMDTTAQTSELDVFSDGATTHAWAASDMAWCVQNGILQGKGNGVLDPRSQATRAEVAVMLQRFVNLITK